MGSERIRLTTTALTGRVVEWKGNYGWIEPQCLVDHPDVPKHQGHIFCHSEDTVPKWRSLTVGSLVEFHLYHDGQGLGAEECVSRKVLRLTLPWTSALDLFGENGDTLPDFEASMNVTMRAYQWMLMDGAPSQLPFLLFEVWGRPKQVVEAVVKMSTKDGSIEPSLLVPECRQWKVHLGQIQEWCPSATMSQELTITSPMSCFTLDLKGTAEECAQAIHILMGQVCD
mmetsp:Transcript_36740/g.84582  ORF Transcript_36740/g.84582 Transcript_36740/m.84582 type:complete len:227 (-) Transcript_36740:47-727(-)